MNLNCIDIGAKYGKAKDSVNFLTSKPKEKRFSALKNKLLDTTQHNTLS